MFLLSYYIKISKFPAMCHRRKLLNLPAFSISFLFRSIKQYFFISFCYCGRKFWKGFFNTDGTRKGNTVYVVYYSGNILLKILRKMIYSWVLDSEKSVHKRKFGFIILSYSLSILFEWTRGSMSYCCIFMSVLFMPII